MLYDVYLSFDFCSPKRMHNLSNIIKLYTTKFVVMTCHIRERKESNCFLFKTACSKPSDSRNQVILPDVLEAASKGCRNNYIFEAVSHFHPTLPSIKDNDNILDNMYFQSAFFLWDL